MNTFGSLPAFLLLLTAGSALAQQPEPPPADAKDDIIITGRRLSDTERTLAECLARKCPPGEDIDATLAHAENLFVAGEYQRARMTTKASLGRNRRHAAALPVPVSDLERSNGRISAHLGETFDYTFSTWGILRALKAGLPESDPRLIGARMEIAQMIQATHRYEIARKTFEQAVSDAAKIDRPDLVAAGRLRLAGLEFVDGDEGLGRKALEKIANRDDPRTRGARMTARLLLAQVDRQRGKEDRTEDLLAEIRKLRLKQPVLLFAPHYELVENRGVALDGQRMRLDKVAPDAFDKKWIDVGFWVRPDGRVEDVNVLRSQGATKWADPLLTSIKGRLYTPVAENDSEGAFRVERFTYTSFFETQTGTRVRQRGARARVESLDLTLDRKTASKTTG